MIGMATQAIGGLTSIASGIIGGGKRRAEQRAAEKELAINKARYENLDTSNLAANMENTFEDLTVNTQAADFAAQQQQATLANTMSGMNQAAGGSGIAALAQAMAGQQSANAQSAAASIGQQEAANQRAAAYIKKVSRRPGAHIKQLKDRPTVAPPDKAAIVRHHGRLPRVS